ncbi:MAG: gfo/Idh/MocA family oxidoreductase, partial [Actinomycetota bacterium]
LKDFYDAKKVGGPMLDLHVHDAHFIRVVCGMPKAVQSVGRMRGEVVEQFSTQFLYDDSELVVTATSGVIRQQGRGFTHAYEIYLEKATLLFDLAVIDGQGQTLMPVTVLESSGKVVRPELAAGDAFTPFVAELNEVSRAIRTGKPSPLLAGELARDAVVLCHKQTESVRRGKAVKI